MNILSEAWTLAVSVIGRMVSCCRPMGDRRADIAKWTVEAGPDLQAFYEIVRKIFDNF